MDNNSLRRQLSPMHVWAIAFGCVIGWGSFINPGKKFLPNSGVAGTTIAMILGALVMIVIAFSYAYMVPKYPNAGGEFSYNIAGFDIYMGEMLLSMTVLILFGWLNMIGVRKAGIVQTILSSLLVSCVFVLFLSAVFSAKAKGVNMRPIWGFDKAAAKAAGAVTADISQYAHTGTAGVLSAILATFAIAPWAYVGFDAIPQAAEEFNFSFKKVSFIMMIAIVFGCFVYVSNNAVAAAALENWPERVMAGDWVLLIAAEELLGNFGKVLIGLGVSCAVLSGIMGFYLASSRLMYSMSREGYLPEWFGKVNEKYGTPRNAILFCILVSLSGPILGREALGWFVDMSAIGASIGYFLLS